MNFSILIASLIVHADSGHRRQLSESLSAAAGLIAKRSPQQPQEIDDRAGYSGRVDIRYKFGVEPRKEDTFLVVEAKYLKTPVEPHRWYVVSNSLMPQILQSLIGHGAPVGLALTQEGLKVFLFEEVPDNEITDQERLILDGKTGKLMRILCFPEAEGEFFRPDFTRIDEALQIIGELARIISAFKEAVTPIQAPKSDPTTPLTADRVGGRHQPTGGPAVRGVARSKAMNQPYFLRDSEGGMKRVESICLQAFYTDKEIEDLLDPTTASQSLEAPLNFSG